MPKYIVFDEQREEARILFGAPFAQDLNPGDYLLNISIGVWRLCVELEENRSDPRQSRNYWAYARESLVPHRLRLQAMLLT